jgi:hypothetical protein
MAGEVFNQEEVPYFASRCDDVKIFLPTEANIRINDLSKLLPQGTNVRFEGEYLVVVTPSLREASKIVSSLFQGFSWSYRYDGQHIHLTQ